MKFFDELGSLIQQRWRAHDFDVERFPELATEALAERSPIGEVKPLDVLRWVLTAPELPAQHDLEALFGNPITLYRSPRFFINMHLWLDGSTTVHQHGFSGAFMVLEGSSIHCEYRFEPSRRLNDLVLLGDIQLAKIELLELGGIRPIAGKRTIHSLFHLDRPSASLVVRTPIDPLAGPQYDYRRPGLAFDPFFRSEQLTRQIQTLTLLHHLEHPDYDRLVVEAVAQSDSITTVHLLNHVATQLSKTARFRDILEAVRPQHPVLMTALAPALERMRRDLKLVNHRRLLHHPEHRFFLALLLNLDQRKHIDDLVAKRFPKVPPWRTLSRWIREISSLPPTGDFAERGFGIKLGAGELSVLDLLLQGVPPEQVPERMCEEYADEDVARQAVEIGRLCGRLKQASWFRSLFAW